VSRVLIVGLNLPTTRENANKMREALRELVGLESVVIDNCSTLLLVDIDPEP